jgi:hypothetical protein
MYLNTPFALREVGQNHACSVLKNVSLFCPFSMSSCMEYTCPCGKKHKSRNTVSRHKKAEAQKSVLGTVPKDKKGQEKGQQEDKKGQSFLKEINLQGEFTKMTDIVNPKKPEEPKEAKFKCGACGGTFNDKYKRCPHCGVEFE